ncbi:hypothetical protein [Pedobacter punctiformis]|uniref:Uncharacterized protein n=1 Tax=Pedobacter punctiformis TaxID=3004097 RepID=A0ABT4LAL5_9SPHI|nr:hypothetical protein [Pedobacter sp. HCMS5-2]MCZ4244203.1 hypothetical protein [Pedobacter sp. HCMS5-2]
MKKILVMCAILCMHNLAFGQKVFQSGNYGKQKQKSYLELEGVLKDKYKNKGFYWFNVQRKDDVCIVNIVDTALFNKTTINTPVTLKECFELDSNQWKKKLN